MEIRPGVELVPGLPVVLLRGTDTLVLADLHLGFEDDMASKGVYLPRVQYEKAVGLLREALEKTRASRVVIAGDVKHVFSRLTWQERTEVGGLFSFLKERVEEVVVVRGNHDNYLAAVAEAYGVEIVPSLRLGDVLIIHGHVGVEMREGDLVIMGHEHPSIALRDSIGVVARFPCFLHVPLRNGAEALVLPAAGAYQSGNPVGLDPSKYLSPIVKELGVVERARPIIVDEEVGLYEFPELGLLGDMLA